MKNRSFPWIVIETQSNGHEYLVAGFISGRDARHFADNMRKEWPDFTYRLENPGY